MEFRVAYSEFGVAYVELEMGDPLTATTTSI
jgi:hypothetical protein